MKYIVLVFFLASCSPVCLKKVTRADAYLKAGGKITLEEKQGFCLARPKNGAWYSEAPDGKILMLNWDTVSKVEAVLLPKKPKKNIKETLSTYFRKKK
jgi:hypothetical protein